MSLPPPPGLKQPPPSSLPPRPPPPAGQSSSFKPAYSSAPSYASSGAAARGYGGNVSQPPSTGYNAFTAFQPRAVAASQPYHTSSPVVSAPPAPSAGYSAPTTGYGAGYPTAQPSYQAGPSYYGQPQYGDNTYGQQYQNPYPVPGQDANAYGMRGKSYGRQDPGYDPETEAQIAQWQSAYISKDTDASGTKGKKDGTASAAGATTGGATGTSTPSSGPTAASTTPAAGAGQKAEQKTVIRHGGGHTWTDPTLLEWDPAHFRLFVGNLAGEVTDESLFKAFSKYPSIQKARVIRDRRTEKSKGYGFVSFSDGDDYFKAAREMQGKYIGSHPVLLRRATTEIRPVSTAKLNKKGGGGGGAAGAKGGAPGGGTAGKDKVKSDGVKKQPKTKGGLKILG